jgi:iron complex transport system ATP-binding protein
VLRDVTLELRAGEVLGVLGPNGAGKTSLVRTVAGVLAPQAGSLRLGGTPFERLSRRERARRVAVVPQDTQIAFPFSALEVVLMGRSPHLPWLAFEGEQDVARARAALERLGISALAERSVQALSGGERQLVLLARALAQDPEVLLLDEPTAFLDLRHRVAVADLLRELAGEGRAALVVSHDFGLSLRRCDRVALLAGGRVRAVGAPEEVLTAERIREVWDVEARLVRTPEGELFLSV